MGVKKAVINIVGLVDEDVAGAAQTLEKFLKSKNKSTTLLPLNPTYISEALKKPFFYPEFHELSYNSHFLNNPFIEDYNDKLETDLQRIEDVQNIDIPNTQSDFIILQNEFHRVIAEMGCGFLDQSSAKLFEAQVHAAIGIPFCATYLLHQDFEEVQNKILAYTETPSFKNEPHLIFLQRAHSYFNKLAKQEHVRAIKSDKLKASLVNDFIGSYAKLL